MAGLCLLVALSETLKSGILTIRDRREGHGIVKGDEHPQEELLLLEWSEGLLQAECGGNLMAGVFERAGPGQRTLLRIQKPRGRGVSREPPVGDKADDDSQASFDQEKPLPAWIMSDDQHCRLGEKELTLYCWVINLEDRIRYETRECCCQ